MILRTAVTKVDQSSWLVLVLAAPFLLFPTPLTTPVLLVVPALWLVSKMAKNEIFPHTPVNGALLLMYLMVLVSLFASYDWEQSLPKISGMVLGIGVFSVVVQLGRAAKGWWLCWAAFMAAGVLISALGLIGTQWPAQIKFFSSPKVFAPGFLSGLLGSIGGFHPNEVAGALLWSFPALLVLAITAWRSLRLGAARFGRLTAGLLASALSVLAIVAFLVLLLTQSRSAYVALVGMAAFLVWVILSKPWRWFFAAAGTAGICLAGWLVSQTNWLVTARPLQENTIAVPGTLNLRMEVWSRAVSAIRDFSWTGMGMNLFRTTSESMYPLFLIDPSRDIAHAHNEFLQAALDLGIAGLVAFLALNLAAVIMLRRLWLRLPAVAQFLHPLQDAPLISRAVVLGLAGGLISHMIYGMADAVGLGAKPGVLFWLLIALVTALYIRVSLPNIPVQDQRV